TTSCSSSPTERWTVILPPRVRCVADSALHCSRASRAPIWSQRATVIEGLYSLPPRHFAESRSTRVSTRTCSHRSLIRVSFGTMLCSARLQRAISRCFPFGSIFFLHVLVKQTVDSPLPLCGTQAAHSRNVTALTCKNETPLSDRTTTRSQSRARLQTSNAASCERWWGCRREVVCGALRRSKTPFSYAWERVRRSSRWRPFTGRCAPPVWV